MRLSLALGLGLGLVTLVLGCAPEAQGPPAPLVAQGGACASTLDCADGLHCSAGACAAPSDELERSAVQRAKLKRDIAETHRLEKAAYTAQGKERMRDKRTKLEAELAALGG